MRRTLPLIVLLLALPVLAQTTQIRVFELQHRSAAELIDAVGPLVDPQGAVSGTGYTLIVRSSLQNLAELEQAIKALDAPLRQFLITVRHGARQDAVRHSAAGSGTLRDGNASVTIGGDGPPRVTVYSTHGNRDERIAQQLRVTEGGWAQIRAGEAVPVPQQSITQGPGGTTVQQSIEYRDVDTGFEVRPRLAGDDRVTLSVRPFRQRPAATGGGVIEQQQLETTVTGRLGEWIALGGGVDTRLENRRGILYSTKERDRLTRRVFIRVDLIDD